MSRYSCMFFVLIMIAAGLCCNDDSPTSSVNPNGNTFDVGMLQGQWSAQIEKFVLEENPNTGDIVLTDLNGTMLFDSDSYSLTFQYTGDTLDVTYKEDGVWSWNEVIPDKLTFNFSRSHFTGTIHTGTPYQKSTIEGGAVQPGAWISDFDFDHSSISLFNISGVTIKYNRIILYNKKL